MKATNDEPKIIHCSIVGDSLVGKTSLIKKFLEDDCTDNHTATIFDNFAGNIPVAGSNYTVSVFDTTGLHDFGGLRYLPYAQSKIIIVCYSVTDRSSFDNVSNFWIHEVKKYSRKCASIILVATHCDMATGSGVYVNRNEGVLLAQQIGAFALVETSMYDLDNVSKVFESVVIKAVKKKRSIIKKILGR